MQWKGAGPWDITQRGDGVAYAASHTTLFSTCIWHRGKPCSSGWAAAPTHNKIRDLENSSQSKEQLCLSPPFSLFLFPMKATLATEIKNNIPLSTAPPSKKKKTTKKTQSFSSEPRNLSSSSNDRVSDWLSGSCVLAPLHPHPSPS